MFKNFQFKVLNFQFFAMFSLCWDFLLNLVKISKYLFSLFIKKCKDLSVGRDLTEFVKRLMPESLDFFFFLIKKPHSSF